MATRHKAVPFNQTRPVMTYLLILGVCTVFMLLTWTKPLRGVQISFRENAFSVPEQTFTVVTAPSPDDNYVAMCVAVKDQHEDIHEWLQYYAALGVHRAYVFDHNSSVLMRDTLAPNIASGQVVYEYVGGMSGVSIPEGVPPQLWMYDRCLRLYGGSHAFLAFFDVDEFLVLFGQHARRSLPDFLHDYADYGGLGVNWRLFGSSGYITRPPLGVTKSYSACLPENHPQHRHIKTIVNTRFTERVGRDPHHFVYNNGSYAVSENFERIDSAFSNSISMHKVALYHYVTKSLEEYSAKIKRGSAMRNFKRLDYFLIIQKESTDNCTTLL